MVNSVRIPAPAAAAPEGGPPSGRDGSEPSSQRPTRRRPAGEDVLPPPLLREDAILHEPARRGRRGHRPPALAAAFVAMERQELRSTFLRRPSLPPPTWPLLTSARLHAWATGGVDPADHRARQHVMRQVLQFSFEDEHWGLVVGGPIEDRSGRRGLDLSAPKFTGLTSLPDGLCVDGDLILGGRAELREIPANVKVSGSLMATRCRHLTRVGEGLYVGQELRLNGCTALTVLPDDMRAGAVISLRDCTGVTNLPTSFRQWGVRSNTICACGTRCYCFLPSRHGLRVVLLGTSIGDAQLRTLRENYPIRMRIEHRPHVLPNWYEEEQRANHNHPPANAQQLVERHGNIATAATVERLCTAMEPWTQQGHTYQVAQWQLAEDEAADLALFLQGLAGTADYVSPTGRPILEARVSAMLDAMENDTDIRTLCVGDIQTAMESCGDRVMLHMNLVEQHVNEHQAISGALGQTALHNLGLGLMGLEIARRHAADTCDTQPGWDEVEVRLAYEIGLRERLLASAEARANAAGDGWPITAQSMLYPRLTPVDIDTVGTDALDAAFADAEEALHNPEKVRTHFAQWPAWQRHLRHQAAAAHRWQSVRRVALPNTLDREDTTCLGPQTFGELLTNNAMEPVFIANGAESPHLYARSALLTWWIDKGTDPMTRQRFGLSDLRRP